MRVILMVKMKKVIIDDREGGRIRYAQLDAYDDLETEVKHLEYGDYIFVGYNDTKVCFEYKTGTDFLASVYANRLHNQVAQNIRVYDYTFVMVEAFNLEKLMQKFYYQTGITLDSHRINGAVAKINTVSTVLFAQTREAAFDLMYRQAYKIINNKPFLYKFGKKNNNPIINYLASIKGVSNQAETIVHTLNIRTLEELLNITEEDLTPIHGIGETRAKQIIQKIRTAQ